MARDGEALVGVFVHDHFDTAEGACPFLFSGVPKTLVDVAAMAELRMNPGELKIFLLVCTRSRAAESQDNELAHLIDSKKSSIVSLAGVFEFIV